MEHGFLQKHLVREPRTIESATLTDMRNGCNLRARNAAAAAEEVYMAI